MLIFALRFFSLELGERTLFFNEFISTYQFSLFLEQILTSNIFDFSSRNFSVPLISLRIFTIRLVSFCNRISCKRKRITLLRNGGKKRWKKSQHIKLSETFLDYSDAKSSEIIFSPINFATRAYMMLIFQDPFFSSFLFLFISSLH